MQTELTPTGQGEDMEPNPAILTIKNAASGSDQSR